MKLKAFADADSVAREAAAIVAADAREAITARGRFVMAVSGGHTPWLMLRALAREEVPWEAGHIGQVEERVGPGGDPDRKLTQFRENRLEPSVFNPGQN